MGNRAVITTKEKSIGLYVHWNGGRDSITAFITYCKIKGYRQPEDDNYGWARLTQVIANYFGGITSIGIDTLSNLDCDNYDNGIYIIENWEIIEREYFDGNEQDTHNLLEMLIDIDDSQPLKEQLGQEEIKEYLSKRK